MKIILATFLLLASLGSAWAHKADRPDLDKWFNSLTNKQGGECCESHEARAVGVADYEPLADGDYKVRLDGTWYNVPESRVIKGPNYYGEALVWPFTNMGGLTEIRCFLPGAGM